MIRHLSWSLAALVAAGLASGGSPERREATQSDPLAAKADSLVKAGRAWRATVLVSPSLTTPTSASAELRMAGARAAAAWDGWTEVDRLLRGAPWLDQQFGGDGRELLARSALDRNVDATPDAVLALAAATDEPRRSMRRVLLARAYDRANARDSAAAEYLAAIGRLPRAADWLRLRAAGVTSDSAARAALFARVVGVTPRLRIAATDGQARERSNDYAGAAVAYRRAGMPGAAYKVEALADTSDAARGALAKRIVAFLNATPAPAAGEVRQTLDVLDKLGTMPPQDELVASRAAATNGVPARAIVGFARAAAAAPLSAADRMTYAGALARGARAPDAIKLYATVTDDQALAPLAAYQRGRLLAQSGDGATARTALRSVATQYATVRAAAASALLLLADLQVDDGDLTGAAQSLHELVARDPKAPQVPLARFRSGLIAWADAPATAAMAFDSLATLFPTNDEGVAARYWAGRAYEKLGKHGEAEARWQEVIRSSPQTYYAELAAKRLKTSQWSAPAGPDTVAHVAAIDSIVERVADLRRLGLDVEARFEIDALAERAVRVPAEAAVVAQGLMAVGDPARAVRVAVVAIGRGNATRALYRLAYPVLHADALAEESARNSLDPALVAGLIRQESSWNPRAVSVAAARGLMQLLPSVGASIAASKKYPLWNPALLFDADVSLELGTAHLSSSFRRDTPVERALAAYNAGASRVARWVQRPGADDAELFTEWIPFTETRDYVRVVLRNAEVYRALGVGQ